MEKGLKYSTMSLFSNETRQYRTPKLFYVSNNTGHTCFDNIGHPSFFMCRIILDTHALDNVWFSASIVEFDLIGSEEHAYICTSVDVF